MEARAVTTTIQRWGNSLAIRIPKAYALEAGLEENTEVEIGVRAGTLVVRPARKDWSLDELVAGITPSNTHGEISWGTRTGREVW
jgi:antitoxin MazE